ncbi:hypothetical protein [Actinacidiphila glaucinigra]|uniref:hypothetical protein n=1 Tax=Actinacidiphila glaucinigra TaxID=235986 RepID=UPI002E375E2A|nr:hypothetical protein [Actinacidiphila glaucinigra]
MGFINDAKANMAGTEAKKAREKGQKVLVYKFIEANKSSMSTAPMAGIGEQIEAIEAEGWRLYNLAGAEGKALSGERSAVIALFRLG